MATKPTVVYAFAPTGLYTGGPFIGSDVKVDPAGLAEGYIPGTVVPAEFFNFMFNASGLWSSWLLAGSPGPGLDAHPVETTAAGSCAIASMSLGGTAHANFPLTLSQNTGGVQGLLLVTKGSTGDPAIQGDSVATTMFLTHSIGAGSATAELESTASGLCLQLTQADTTPLRPTFNFPELEPSAPLVGDVWKTIGTASTARGKLSYQDANGAADRGESEQLILLLSFLDSIR